MFPGDRSTVTQTATGISVEVPVERNWIVTLAMAVWLFGWTMGELSAIRELIDAPPGGRIFLLFWLAGWTVGGGLATGLALWSVIGTERVEFDPEQITVRRLVFGFGPSTRYDMHKAANLRVEHPGDPVALAPQPDGRQAAGAAPLAFDYEDRTVRFARGVPRPEAARIVQTVVQRFGRLAPHAG